MIKFNNFSLCTVKEFAEVLAYNIKENNWVNCDFVMPNEPTIDITNGIQNFMSAVNTSEGWFGVKKIKTGFNNDEYDIFFDYYGCGCGQYLNVYETDDYRNNVESIQRKIINVIAEHGDGELKPWDLLFIEILEVNQKKKGE